MKISDQHTLTSVCLHACHFRCVHGWFGSSEHNNKLAASKKQLDDFGDAKDEEVGKLEFDIKKLKADLDIANQKAKVMRRSYREL